MALSPWLVQNDLTSFDLYATKNFLVEQIPNTKFEYRFFLELRKFEDREKNCVQKQYSSQIIITKKSDKSWYSRNYWATNLICKTIELPPIKIYCNGRKSYLSLESRLYSLAQWPNPAWNDRFKFRQSDRTFPRCKQRQFPWVRQWIIWFVIIIWLVSLNSLTQRSASDNCLRHQIISPFFLFLLRYLILI